MNKFRLVASAFVILSVVLISATSQRTNLTKSLSNLAFADGSVNWTGNGSDASLCTGDHAGQTHWVFNTGGNDTVTAATLHIGADSYSMDQNGNGSWSVYVPGGAPSSAYVTYTGSLGNGNPVLTISCLGTAATATPTVTASPTPGEEQHYACVRNSCALVEGSGDNTCESNQDCEETTPTPTITITPTETPSNPGGPGDGLGCAVRDCSSHPTPQGQVLGASTQAVLGLSSTSSSDASTNEAILLLGSVLMLTSGFAFLKRNA